jgi:hypothetical protein
MKKYLLLTLLFISSVSFADNTTSKAVSGSTSSAGAGAYIDNSSKNSGNVAAANLSSAVGMSYAPALTTTLTETCMGSTSAGAGFSGGSFSFGTTWRDSTCIRRLDAREIKSFGDIQAAKEIMCDSDLVREAFKRVGRPCAIDGGNYGTAVVPAASVATIPEASVQPFIKPEVKAEVSLDEATVIKNQNAATLRKADEAREAMRLKGY